MVTVPVLLETIPEERMFPRKSYSALLLEARYQTDGQDAIGGQGPEDFLLTKLMRIGFMEEEVFVLGLEGRACFSSVTLAQRTGEDLPVVGRGRVGRSTKRTANSTRSNSHFVAPSCDCWLEEKVSVCPCVF